MHGTNLGRGRLWPRRSRWAICRIPRSFGLSPTAPSRRRSRARISWLISPKARGTSHLNWDREGEHTLGRPKHFRTSDRPRNSRERNWPTRQMSVRARSILICRKGRSPQRRCLNGSKNRMKPIWFEPASSPFLVRMHPKVRRDLARFGELDHVHRRSVAAFLTLPAYHRRARSRSAGQFEWRRSATAPMNVVQASPARGGAGARARAAIGSASSAM